MNCLVAVIGPTAAGKSKLGLSLAQKFRGAIINADSRQIYHYMDIGTAKPSIEERSSVANYLFDIIYPEEPFSLGTYQLLADKAIQDIQIQNNVPFLVGGSGLYVWAVLEGWKAPHVAPDSMFRQNMELKAAKEGCSALYQELQQVDSVSAALIMPTNLRRIIRALEIYRNTGIPASQLRKKNGLPFPVLIIGLTASREKLYRMVDCRVDEMIKKGLIDEVNNLMARGYSPDLPSMSSIGYRQIIMYLKGQLDLAEATQQIKYETHRFVRHQYAWFRLSDKRIQWFNIFDEPHDKIVTMVEDFLNSCIMRQVSYDIC